MFGHSAITPFLGGLVTATKSSAEYPRQQEACRFTSSSPSGQQKKATHGHCDLRTQRAHSRSVNKLAAQTTAKEMSLDYLSS